MFIYTALIAVFASIALISLYRLVVDLSDRNVPEDKRFRRAAIFGIETWLFVLSAISTYNIYQLETNEKFDFLRLLLLQSCLLSPLGVWATISILIGWHKRDKLKGLIRSRRS